MIAHAKISARAAARAAVVVVIVALAGWVGLSTAAASKRDSVTISFLGTSTQQTVWQAIIANFNRVYPNITVNATFAPVQTYFTLLATELQAGNGPDVWWTSTGNGTTGALYLGPAGYAADLSDQPWVKRIPATILPSVAVGTGKSRKVYAFPQDISGGFGFYNKAVFKADGFKIPKTWSDLLSLCSAANAKGIAAIGFGGSSFIDFTNVITPFIAQEVDATSPNWETRKANGQVSFATSPQWHAVLQDLVDLKNANCFSSGVLGETRASTIQELATGQVLIYPTYSLVYNQMEAAFGSNASDLGAFAFPSRVAKQQRIPLSPEVMQVNAHSSQLAAAKTFVAFIARSKQDTFFCKLQGSIAPFDLLKDKLPDYWAENMAPYFATSVNGKKVAQKAIISSTTYAPVGTAVAMTNMELNLAGLFTGSKTVDGLLAQMDSDWNAGYAANHH